MNTIDTAMPWKPWQCIAFRFLFVFLGFFLLDYFSAMTLLNVVPYQYFGKVFDVFSGPLHWLDTHFYHTGYDPAIHESYPGDGHFGLVYYITFFIIAVVITIIWSIAGRKKQGYPRLNYWFCFYIRYAVGLIMLVYGLGKVIPVQMGYPSVVDQITPAGDMNLFSTAWYFVGASPGYEIFAGVLEVTAALLLLFPGTYIFGSLLMCTVLSNVVALNMFYNIPVKLYSSLTLLSVIYVLAPHLRVLYRFFFSGKTISLDQKKYIFKSRGKHYLLKAVCILLPVAVIGDSINANIKRYQETTGNNRNAKLYQVQYFIAGDTLAPLTTDTLRWQKMAMAYSNTMAVYNMHDSSNMYDYDKDTVAHTLRVHTGDDSTQWSLLHYTNPGKKLLQLNGPWRGHEVQILLQEIPKDSSTLDKDKITFFVD